MLRGLSAGILWRPAEGGHPCVYVSYCFERGKKSDFVGGEESNQFDWPYSLISAAHDHGCPRVDTLYLTTVMV